MGLLRELPSLLEFSSSLLYWFLGMGLTGADFDWFTFMTAWPFSLDFRRFL